MKKFLTIGFITILILLTTYTKNLTKTIDEKIFALKERSV